MLLGEIKVMNPGQQEGSTQQKLQAIFEYMQQLNKQIRFVLENIDTDNLSPALNQTMEELKTGLAKVESVVTQDDFQTLVRQTAQMIESKASAKYKDPVTGSEIDLWTQVIQTAEEITQKADKTYTDAGGNTVDLATQVRQTAEEITQKADKTYTDGSGNTVDLATQVRQTAEEITQKADKTYTDGSGNTVVLATQVAQNASDIATKASKTYRDGSGNTVDLVTQVKQNATDITTKADKTYRDGSGNTVDLATQVQQNATDITSKADKTYTDGSGNTVTLATQVQQSASDIVAMASGAKTVGAVKSTKVTINTGGVSIATGGTFTVDSGNFLLDGDGNLTANGAQINGELLSGGRAVLTGADIYIGTAEPSGKKAGMIWIQPLEDDSGNKTVQTTHTGQYTAGSRAGLKSNPKTVVLTGTAQTASADHYEYEFAIPVYFYNAVSNATLSVRVGSKTFTSPLINGNAGQHRVIHFTATHTAWLANAGSISIVISASTDSLNNERQEDGYQVSMISRAY